MGKSKRKKREERHLRERRCRVAAAAAVTAAEPFVRRRDLPPGRRFLCADPSCGRAVNPDLGVSTAFCCYMCEADYFGLGWPEKHGEHCRNQRPWPSELPMQRATPVHTHEGGVAQSLDPDPDASKKRWQEEARERPKKKRRKEKDKSAKEKDESANGQSRSVLPRCRTKPRFIFYDALPNVQEGPLEAMCPRPDAEGDRPTLSALKSGEGMVDDDF